MLIKLNNIKYQRMLGVLSSLFLAGCQLIAPYKSPLTSTPNEWKTNYNAYEKEQLSIGIDGKKNSPTHSNSPSETPIEEDLNLKGVSTQEVRRNLCDWWQVFQDPLLDQLEEQALDSSYTLWAALERVIKARAEAQMSYSPLLPGVNLTPSFNKTSSLLQNMLPGLKGTTSGGMTPIDPQITQALASLLGTFPKEYRFVQTQYLIPLTFNYEIDLWSQLHNAYYASVMNAQAVSQAYLSVLLSLTADVASTYYQIRGLDTQENVLQRNIKSRLKAFNLNKSRYEAGLINYMDVSNAELELARARADKDEIQRLREIQENILAKLVGVPAPVFSLEHHPLQIPPPIIPTGIPSELLTRRPDIAEAERKLASAYQQIGVAYANFFPSLTLNTSLGLDAPFINSLFDWKARLWEIGLNITQTVFDAGRNEANLNFYQANCRESMANYQQQVLQAFQEVEDSLASLKAYVSKAKDLKEAVRAAHLTLEIAQLRYSRGLTDYLNVVDAERQLLQTEQNSAVVLGQRYLSTVTLIRALGGSWY